MVRVANNSQKEVNLQSANQANHDRQMNHALAQLRDVYKIVRQLQKSYSEFLDGRAEDHALFMEDPDPHYAEEVGTYIASFGKEFMPRFKEANLTLAKAIATLEGAVHALRKNNSAPNSKPSVA